jgi:hypothetical protein
MEGRESWRKKGGMKREWEEDGTGARGCGGKVENERGDGN